MKKIWEKFAVIINIVLVLSVYLFFYLVFWKDWNFIEKLGLLEKVGEINIHSDGTIFWGLIVPGLVYLIMFIIIFVVVAIPSLIIWNTIKDLLFKKRNE